MQQVSVWPHALESAADADRIGLGAKSAEKVREILSTGASSRVEEAARDEAGRAVSLLARVWGVGADTAERWYASGVRSLEDALALPNLTAQQRVRDSWLGVRRCCVLFVLKVFTQ